MRIARTAIAVGVILFAMAGIGACGRERKLVEMDELGQKGEEQELIVLPTHERAGDSSIMDSDEDESDGMTKLTALADDLEEAEKIADLYGIELDSFSYGVAVYVTDKDVNELISMGEEKDYPTLAPNHKQKLYTEQ